VIFVSLWLARSRELPAVLGRNFSCANDTSWPTEFALRDRPDSRREFGLQPTACRLQYRPGSWLLQV